MTHLSAQVQLFFAVNGADEGEKEDKQAVFTKLNETYLCAVRDGDLRFVYILLFDGIMQ